jgi:hypothetical protein
MTMLRLRIPFQVSRRAEARAAASPSYWKLTKRRAQSKTALRAVHEFLSAGKKTRRTR